MSTIYEIIVNIMFRLANIPVKDRVRPLFFP